MEKQELPTQDELLTQVQHEIEYSLNAVDTKRTIFRERLRKYIEPNKLKIIKVKR